MTLFYIQAIVKKWGEIFPGRKFWSNKEKKKKDKKKKEKKDKKNKKKKMEVQNFRTPNYVPERGFISPKK